MSEEKDLDLLFDNNEVANAGFWGRACSRLGTKNNHLEQENKRLREALEKISKKKEINGCTCFYETEDGFSDCENCDVNMGCTYYIAKQALGE